MNKDNLRMINDSINGANPYTPIDLRTLPDELLIIVNEHITSTLYSGAKHFGFKEAMLTMIMLNNGDYYV